MDCFDDFEDEDSFEDEYDADTEMNDPIDGDADLNGEPDDAESQGDDLTVDPFLIGGAMGFAYEEGLMDRKKRKRGKFRDDPD